MTRLAEDVPQRGGTPSPLWLREPELLQSRGELFAHLPRLCDSAQVPFDVGKEYGNANARELLGEDLERDGLASARRAGNAAVSIGEPGEESEICVPRLGDDKWLGHKTKMGADKTRHQWLERYLTSIVRDALAVGAFPTSSFTAYLPAGTRERSSSTDLADRTSDAPFSCQRILRGVSFGAIRSTRKVRRNRPSSSGVIVSEIGIALSAGARPYSSHNNPTLGSRRNFVPPWACAIASLRSTGRSGAPPTHSRSETLMRPESSAISANPDRHRAAAALSYASSSTPISCDFHGVITVNTLLAGDSTTSALTGKATSSPMPTSAAANLLLPKIVSALTSYAATTRVESPRRKRASWTSSLTSERA